TWTTYHRIAMRSASEDDVADDEGRDLVDDQEEHGHDHDEDEHHPRRDHRLLARRPGHLRHFLADLPGELHWIGSGHLIRIFVLACEGASRRPNFVHRLERRAPEQVVEEPVA